MILRRHLPPLRLLAAFESVVRAGGVQSAATELNVTQPAISQALRNLEDHIGTKLLDRRMRPAALTDAGRVLLHAVSDGMDRIETAIGKIRASERIEQNVVTIACTVCTGTYWLMPRLATFYSRHPDVVVRVVPTSGTPQFTPDADIVIRYGAGEWLDGKCEPLFDERLIPVCSPKVVERFGSGNFAEATLIHVETNEELSPGWDEYFDAIGMAHDRQGDLSFGNHVQAAQAALAGMGVMLGWIANTGDLVREERLVIFHNQPIIPGGAYYLMIPLERPRKPASELLASHLRACVGTS